MKIRVRIAAGTGDSPAEVAEPQNDVSGPNTVLVVCFGNLFRSPMAEALLRSRLPAEEWEVASAGTHALGDDPPSPMAQMALAEVEGLDISDQRSSPLTVQDLMAADFIFTMSRQQAAEVVALAPEVADRTRLLGAFAPATEATELAADPGGEPADPDEVGDPIGGDLDVCLDCCHRIAAAADVIAAWLEDGAAADLAPPTVATGLRIPE